MHEFSGSMSARRRIRPPRDNSTSHPYDTHIVLLLRPKRAKTAQARREDVIDSLNSLN